jgi:UDP-3-O-[3-hydroxymyristoyl] glucosamine N-acyltransferase
MSGRPNAVTTPRTLQDIAAVLNADVVGDGTLLIETIAHPSQADGPRVLALAMEPRAEAALPHTAAIAAVVAAGRGDALRPLRGGLIVTRPRYALAQLLELFAQAPTMTRGIHPSAIIDPSASVGADVAVGAHCVIGPGVHLGERTMVFPHVTIGAHVRMGRDCRLHPGVRLGDGCVLGDRVIVHPNAVIGADGFGWVTPEKGSIEWAKETGGRIEGTNVALIRMASMGHVHIDDDVEIGAGTCIDRGTIGATRIGRNTKIDNLVQIGHNCTIGENCLIAGTVGLSGSVTVGDRVSLGGGVGVVEHVTIGDDAVILARSAVATSVPTREFWGGSPAVPYRDFTQQLFHVRRVPRLLRDIQDLKARLARLEQETR